MSMIITLGAEGEFSWMGFAFSVLWGIVFTTFGNILWALIGDIIAPYIHRDRMLYEDEDDDLVSGATIDPLQLPAPRVPPRSGATIDTPLQSSGDQFERHSNRIINDHKLWAKGMVALTVGEEAELRQYIKERWYSPVDEIELPDYISHALRIKMRERSVVTGNSLTPYGENKFPCKDNLTR